MKILVVDDEKAFVKGIKFNLQTEGYEVDVAYDGEAAILQAKQTEYDLVILDLMMPKKDGLQACREIRTFSTVPVIMLTAKGEESDKLLGFESGADDYITKPFSIMELKARVRALIRRAGIVATAAKEGERVLRFGELTLTPKTRLVEKNGQPVELTLKEFELLKLLVLSRGKVLTRDFLLDRIWGYEFYGETRTVDVHIRHIRQKLGDDAHYIETIRGVGYKFNDRQENRL